jgi:hypothetical protein
VKIKRNILAILFTFVFAAVCFSSVYAVESLQTQYGSNGLEVDLVRAKKSGQVLTIVFSFRASNKDVSGFLVNTEEVSCVDNVESKKYHVLKDEKGEFLSSIGNRIHAFIAAGNNKIIWFKFPLPPETSKEIQINLPGVSPFEDVVIER